MGVEIERLRDLPCLDQVVDLDSLTWECVWVAGEPAGRADDERLEEQVVRTRDHVDVAEFLDFQHSTDVAGKLLDRDDLRDLSELRDEARNEVDLGVERVIIRHDRQSDLGDALVVFDDLRLVRAVDRRRKQQHAIGAVILGVLGPLLRLVPADAVHANDDEAATVDGLDGHLDHRAALVVGQG